MMAGRHDLQAMPLGFEDPVGGSQAAFRSALHALSHPGEAVECAAAVPEVPGLMPATVALLLALTDHETPVWWSHEGPARWLRFHTGAPIAPDASGAHFAVAALARASDTPDLKAFNAGTDLSPERSTTLVLELPALAGGPDMTWSGPGLQRPRRTQLAGLPDDFWRHWKDNHARFPRGIDVFFTCGRHIVGLPRTTFSTPAAASATEAI
jgi:alpha-D-ribose 1-methylphosphonate 5-triphosphate synthase subunit PhnH